MGGPMHGLREKQVAPARVEADEAVTPPLPDGGAAALGLGVGPASDLHRASDVVGQRPSVERRRLVRARVARTPPLEVLEGREAVELAAVAAGVGEDEVVAEVERVAGPRDEVVDDGLAAYGVRAVEAAVSFDRWSEALVSASHCRRC